MSSLIDIPLWEEGQRFVRERLMKGLRYSQLLVEEVDLGTGVVTTQLPIGTSLEAALRFSEGGKLSPSGRMPATAREGHGLQRIPTTRAALARRVSRVLARDAEVCILENASASPGDAWLEGLAMRMVFFGSEVYHILEGATPAKDVDTAIKLAQSLFHFVGGVSCLGPEEHLPVDRHGFDSSLLRSLASRTSMIFVGAYDGEGYVVWRRRRDL